VSSPSIQLQQCVLTPADFQQKWGSFSDAGQIQGGLAVAADSNTVQSTLAQRMIRCVASGGAGGSLKFYLYAQVCLNSSD